MGAGDRNCRVRVGKRRTPGQRVENSGEETEHSAAGSRSSLCSNAVHASETWNSLAQIFWSLIKVAIQVDDT